MDSFLEARSDFLIPPIVLLSGGVDFSNLMITIKEGVGDFPLVAIKYGVLLILQFYLYSSMRSAHRLRIRTAIDYLDDISLTVY